MKWWILFGLCFSYESWLFLNRPPPMADQAVSMVRNNYPGRECPFNFTLYRLMDDEYTYNIQMQGQRDGHPVIRRCEIHRHSTETVDEEYAVMAPEHVHVIEHVCNDLQYDVQKDTVDVPHQRCIDDPDHIECGMEITEENTEEEHDDSHYGATTNTSAIPYITKVIYPGTLWCGAGNIANDVFSNLGEHTETDECCRNHDICKPAIESMKTRYGERNPSVFTVSHCSCDVELYNCFKRANSPVAKEIGRVFFNLVRMNCFDFEMKDYCVSSWLGYCVRTERRPGAVLKSNPHF